MPVSLHNHSWYSLLAGSHSPAALVARAKLLGHSCVALTDTNNLYGVVEFVHAAHQLAIHPIIGASLRLHDQRAVALVADPGGYRSLCRTLTAIHLGPGVSLADLLLHHHEGLHLLVADASLLPKLHSQYRDRLWVEIVRPSPSLRCATSTDSESDLLALAEKLKLRCVASSAARLLESTDAHTFRILRAAAKNLPLDQLPAQASISPQHRLLSPEEIRQRFADLPAAIRGGDCLASLLRGDVLPRGVIMPKPKMNRVINATAYLEALCERGLRERDRADDPEARRRLRRELDVVNCCELESYFLTVREITREVRRRGYSMALRGSAGNSLICYLLGITEVDPLRFGLEMERFLHPGRADLPDIDLDFDWKVRDQVIDHVIEHYGSDHVARISMHLFYQPRSAFRDAAKMFGVANDKVSELLTRLETRVDEILLPDPGTQEPMPPCPRAFPVDRRQWPRLVEAARSLLGRPTHLSLHPGGIVITPQPVEDYAPLERSGKGTLMTQYEKDAVEAIGLVKIDLLGNRALALIDEARFHARAILPPSIQSGSDPATLQLLCAGDTLGVTQMESPAMRHLLIQIQPTCLENVIQGLALLRPGAARPGLSTEAARPGLSTEAGMGMKELFLRRRHGLEPSCALFPALDEVLGQTHGVMLYEDDGLRVIQKLTGLSASDADRFRKRISQHKTKAEGEILRAEFLQLCRPEFFFVRSETLQRRRQGQAPAPFQDRPLRRAKGPHFAERIRQPLEELWGQLAKFNRYSFCKSHAVSYGLIAWQAAWLKAHHPLAFWVSVLNNNMGAYPRRVYIEAIKRAGLEIRLPCVNRSQRFFHPEETAIRTGLAAISGVPEKVIEQILANRESHGPYRDFNDLRRRVTIGPKTFLALIRAGALDFTGQSRSALKVMLRLLQRKRDLDTRDLFDYEESTNANDDSLPQRLWDQWETLGFVIEVPLMRLFSIPQSRGLSNSRDLGQHIGRVVSVRGLVATTRNVWTEDERAVQFVTLEDEYGLIEVTLFAGTCQQVPYLTMGPYTATGVVEERFGALTLTAKRFVVDGA